MILFSTSKVKSNFSVYLTRLITIHSSLRFYPGLANLLGSTISRASSNRIIRLFNKDKILTNKYSQEELNVMMNSMYKLKENRRELFKTFRQISTDKEISLPRSALHDPSTSLLINLFAQHLRLLHPPQKTDNLLPHQINNNQGVTQPSKKLSLDEKKLLFFTEKHDPIVKKMLSMKKNYEASGVINENAIFEWSDYLLTRGNLIDYTDNEKIIHKFFLEYFNIHAKNRDEVLSFLEKKNKEILKKVTLHDKESLYTLVQQQCWVEQDYANKINALKRCLTLLKDLNVQTDKNNLIFLSILSKAMSLDENDTPKLDRDVYVLMNNNPQNFDIKYADHKPDAKEILHALMDKKYFIKQSSEKIPEDHIVSTAPLLHKTIIIPTKNGIYYAGMLTSSKTGTSRLSLTQECNLDPQGRDKEQRFLVYPRFILCNDDNITVDLLALGFTQDFNLENEDVHQKIVQLFKEKQDQWENNLVQELMVVSPDALKNIATMFFKKNLEEVIHDYDKFSKQLSDLTEREKQRVINNRLKDKEEKAKEQNETKYFSKLSTSLKELYKTLKFFDNENKIQQQNAIKHKKRMVIKEALDETKKIQEQEKEKRLRAGQLTIREKREAFQQKAKERNETESSTPKLPPLIENKK